MVDIVVRVGLDEEILMSVKAGKAKRATRACRYGCGLVTLPGPLATHERACELNPDSGYTIAQPKRECRWCGKMKTVGALATHEMYGCPARPQSEPDGPAVKACQYCGMKAMAGALVGHERVCPQRPKKRK